MDYNLIARVGADIWSIVREKTHLKNSHRVLLSSQMDLLQNRDQYPVYVCTNQYHIKIQCAQASFALTWSTLTTFTPNPSVDFHPINCIALGMTQKLIKSHPRANTTALCHTPAQKMRSCLAHGRSAKFRIGISTNAPGYRICMNTPVLLIVTCSLTKRAQKELSYYAILNHAE